MGVEVSSITFTLRQLIQHFLPILGKINLRENPLEDEWVCFRSCNKSILVDVFKRAAVLRLSH